MYTWDYSFFIGDDASNDHVGFAAGDTLFLIGESSGEDEGAQLKEALNSIKALVAQQRPSKLHDLENIVRDQLGLLGESLISFAGIYSVQSVLYAITRGAGEIHISRGGITQKLLYKDNIASGPLKENDALLLCNSAFSHRVSAEMSSLLENESPHSAIEAITPQLKGGEDSGLIALLMKARSQSADAVERTEIVDEEKEDFPSHRSMNDLAESSDTDTQTPIDVPHPRPGPSEHVAPMPSPAQAAHTGLYEAPSETQSDQSYPQPSLAPRASLMSKVSSFLSRLRSGSSVGRKITAFVVLILIAVLVWSVVSGQSRREKAEFIERVAAEEVRIQEKLTEAEDLVGVNTQRSLQLLDESRQILIDMQQEAKEKELEDLPELAQLASMIDKADQAIKKTEAGKFEEYYDLNLIKKGASARSMYTDGEWIVLLDTKNSSVYVLDPTEKSVESYSVSQAKNATHVAIHQDVPYIFGDSIGVMKLVEASKGEVVVPPDSEWGSIKDFWMYSGNIYLLDSGAQDIHKYLVAEEGYSSKRSYFSEGQSISLSKANAMAIDASVYVAQGPAVSKFVSGVKDSFGVSIPDDQEVTFEDVFTSQDTDNVFLMDTDSRRVFVVSKEGTFSKQISAAPLGRADDFIVLPELGILVLAQDTIIALEE